MPIAQKLNSSQIPRAFQEIKNLSQVLQRILVLEFNNHHLYLFVSVSVFELGAQCRL